jgi:hypothetical protein
MRKWAFAGALLFLLTALVIGVRALWVFSTDDAYITLRYVDNWVRHGQLTWNLGEHPPVEGYSSTLYLLLAALALLTGVPPLLVWKLIGVVALVGTCLLLLRWIAPITNRWTALLATTLYACYAGTVWWAVSGLETPTYEFLLLAVLVLFDRSRQATAPSHRLRLLGATSLVVFLCGLTRPEGPVIGILLGAFLVADGIVHRETSKAIAIQALWLALPFAVLYSGYFALRYAHFGRFWPNTFYCKVANAANPWTIIAMFLETARIPLLIGLGGFLNPRQRRLLVLLYGFILLNTALYYGVDPIIGHLNRHSMISLALACTVCAIGLHELLARLRPWAVWSVPLVLSLLTACSFLFNLPNLIRSATRYAGRMEARAQLAAYLRHIPVADYAIGDAGLVPCLTPGVPVYDYYGLNSSEFVAPAINRDMRKYAAWLLSQRPHAVILISLNARQWMPQNERQAELAAVFNEKTGYLDQQITFGAPGDTFQYRVLLRASEHN